MLAVNLCTAKWTLALLSCRDKKCTPVVALRDLKGHIFACAGDELNVKSINTKTKKIYENENLVSTLKDGAMLNCEIAEL